MQVMMQHSFCFPYLFLLPLRLACPPKRANAVCLHLRLTQLTHMLSMKGMWPVQACTTLHLGKTRCKLLLLRSTLA